jgi:hypothetical protein
MGQMTIRSHLFRLPNQFPLLVEAGCVESMKLLPFDSAFRPVVTIIINNDNCEFSLNRN